MRFAISLVTALFIPAIAFAAGADDDTPPKPTKTTTECEAGQVFDEKTAACVDKSSSLIDDNIRYGAVRELAYAAQYNRALDVLDAMDPDDARVLTYRGFIARKTGNPDEAMAYYTAALKADANNLLARSYFGQAHVEAGRMQAAAFQLAEIRARGGRNTWAEVSLKNAIGSGNTSSY